MPRGSSEDYVEADAGRRVVMVLKSRDVLTEERPRRAVLSLRRAGYATTLIYADEAKARADRHILRLAHGIRMRLRSGSLLRAQAAWRYLTILEFCLRAGAQLLRLRPPVIWLHDPALVALVPFAALLRRLGLTRRLVWDQHELPPAFVLDNGLLRRAFQGALGLCDAVVMANPHRVDYLRQRLPGWRPDNVTVLRNYTDSWFAEQERRPLPEDLARWLRGRPYFYVQGGAARARHFPAVVRAVLAARAAPAVFVGWTDWALVRAERERHGPVFDEWIYVKDSVPADEVSGYIDSCLAGIVLYSRASANSWLCEPNRAWQLVTRGKPMICGANPPLAEIARMHRCAIILDDDGRNGPALTAALTRMRLEHGRIAAEMQETPPPAWDEYDALIAERVVGGR